MKKILFMAAAVVLVAAACNSQTAVNNSTETGIDSTNQTAQTPPPPPTPITPPPAVVQNSGQAKVDAALKDLDANISGETTTNTQSDADLTASDKAVVNDADGVNNANY